MQGSPRFFLAAALVALLGWPAVAAPPPPWQPSWFSPAQPVWGEGWVVPLGMSASLRDVTLRQSLRSSLGGERVRIVVSNEYGGAPLTLGPVALRQVGDGPARAVRFQGEDGTVVPAGARVVSDPLVLSVAAGERLEVDLHLPQPTATAGFHWDAQEQTLLLQGNAVGHGTAPVLQVLQTRAFVSGLWVDTGRAPATVVALGDSITDGNGSGIGTDQRWPDHLSRRLAQRGVAVLNAGIAGNRLLRGGWGDSALARLERDVLGHPGVRAVVVLIGTNDIGFPGSPFAPDEAPAALAELQAGLRQLVTQAHARGVRVMAGTLPPFERALEGTPLEGHHSPGKEAQRQALNAWIRQAGVFDAVVDFDAVLRDPAHPGRLAPALDSGDHLHPGDAGYRRMAEAIDLDALLGPSAEKVRP
ncbi:SGNH/GDSL hydrolase family protein [Pseudorhodoferax aquiterrae]|uniref:SGNH/GDSL hydrolase family protein n=1 Tax=Pseudorhodoferax aquiterrae TaxID=747304 RepID=UPI001679271A|nr:SGNH/GDSL hydrolase family protein [Pseudorhodoferax aquiterrae]